MTAEAAEAAAHWGGARLRLILERENAVYEGLFPFGRAALRLHRIGYQAPDAIRSELWWCAALAGAGVPVPRAIASQGGDFLVQLSSGRVASVIDWVDGMPMGRAGEPLPGTKAAQVAQFQALGDLVARFHTATDALALPGWFSRPRWDIAGLVGEAPFWGRFWEHPALDDDSAATLRAARDWLAEVLSEHADGGDFGLIHADVLRENVLFADNGPHLIDFDDSGWGFRAFDLGTVLSQTLAEPALPELAAALVAGYRAQRPLAVALVPAMTLARCCASVGWTMPRLAPDDPVHRRHIARAVGLARQVMGGGVDWAP